MGHSDFLENKILDYYLRAKNWDGTSNATVPGTYYVALFTTLPNDANSGGVEVSGGAYARVAVASSGWNASSGGLVDNVSAINFGTATANWGTIVGVGLFDASTAGNLIDYGSLTANRTVNSGDGPVQFAAGALDLTED